MEGPEHQLALRSASRAAGVASTRVLDVVQLVPRAWFVPDDLRERAGSDVPLPVGYGQTTSQPSLVARILEDLHIAPGMNVLEVGAGFGYEAALATVLASPGGTVTTIERDARIAAEASSRLLRIGELLPRTPWDVQVRIGDGALGAADVAPFDAIIVAATCDEVPRPLLDQLADGGRLIAPVGPRDEARLLRYERHGADVDQMADLGWVRYVPLVSGVTGGDVVAPVQGMGTTV